MPPQNYSYLMKRFNAILTLLFLFIANCLAATPQEALDNFVKTSGVPANSMAVKVIDLKGRDVMASHNSDCPLIPASIMKTATTAALYRAAGPDWRYHTRVYIDGPIDLGILRGNLIILGSCDPSLHSEYEPFGSNLVEEITEALYQMHITSIEGEILIDESEFEGACRPDSWAQGDFKKYYGTGSHAFNFANNASGDFSIENPALKFVTSLNESLSQKGISVTGKQVGEGRRIQIIDHLSPPLDEIMRSCMMRSDNLFAECMLRTFGKLNGTDGSTDAGAALEAEIWKSKGFPVEGINIVDGSGLSRQNRMTADFMAELLADMSSDPTYASFFPLAGQEGTMKKFLSGTQLDSYIAMKTGSMNGIQCYAGYKLDEDYVPTHVVVIIMNNLPKNRDRAKNAAQKMLLDIFCS